MNADEARILREAMDLSPAARAALAGHLLESLEGSPDPDAEAAWSVEIARRLQAIDAGDTQLQPWAEARRRIVGG